MKKINLNQITGFTLAEVLITLAIIGVIAALTLKTLVANSQKAEHIARLQKATSVLNNGFKQIMANENCSDIPCTGIIGSTSDETIDNIEKSNIFSIIKKCHVGETGCHDNMVYGLNNTVMWVPNSYYSMLILQDGSIIGFYMQYPNCNYSTGFNQYSSVCVSMAFIDLNGSKPPNKFGRDLFRFYLSQNGTILAAGANNDTKLGYWNVNAGSGCVNGNGQTCFGRIVEESWQMNY